MIAVIGGGISGLTAAFRLHAAGREVVVLEAGDVFGGALRTSHDDGWLFEAGPNTVLSKPEMDRLISLAGLDGERLNAAPSAARRYIVKGGRLVALPGTPPAFFMTPLFSAGAKLRLFREPFIARHPGPDETIGDFTRRRLGPEFLDYAVGPFVSGVYAGDPEKLSVRHAVRKIHALEANHGSLIRGALALAKAGRETGPAPRGTILSFRAGLDTLPRTLAARLGPAARARTRVESITRSRGGPEFEIRVRSGGASGGPGASSPVESIFADTVIVATDVRETARILAPLDAANGNAARVARLADVPYAGVAVAGFGFRRADVGHPLDGFGFLAPRREQTGILGCLFTSSLFPGRAPEGCVGLTTIAGGATDPAAATLAESELIGRMMKAMTPLLAIRGEAVHVGITRWPRAIPQYNLGHQEFLDIADRLERNNPGLHLIGNWRGGVSVGDCVENASALAARLLVGTGAPEPV